MTSLKCKICGGTILPSGKSYGVCDSCGSEVTLPRIDDDVKADLYNRGNQERQNGDFDRAYATFEHIIANDPTDAEAHWCMVLCRYGIEYVEDPVTGERKPTCSRISYDPILEDIDYLKALQYSDFHSREIYTRDAENIDKILQKYIQISKNEPPYDVFICFKATEENGERTQDSVIAQEIYDQLTEKGLKVFFSRITLQDKQGEEYEPYIFAALHSAKVMILVGTRKENLEARWVRNEWSRFLLMCRKDKSKSILPVYSGMDPDDFPREIPSYQGIDRNRIGAMQDLVRGVQKLTDHLEENAAPRRYSKSRALTEEEKRIGGRRMIHSVAVKCIANEGGNWKGKAPTAVVDIDKWPVIVFQTNLLEKIEEERTFLYGVAVYDEFDNVIFRQESPVVAQEGTDCFYMRWVAWDGVNLKIQPGTYRAEFWIDDSMADTYRFQVYSDQMETSQIQLSEEERLQKRKREEEIKARKEGLEKAQNRIKENPKKYLEDHLKKKAPVVYEGYIQCIENCIEAEKKCPCWVPFYNIIAAGMVLLWGMSWIPSVDGQYWDIAIPVLSAMLSIFLLQGIMGGKIKLIKTIIAYFIFLFGCAFAWGIAERIVNIIGFEGDRFGAPMEGPRFIVATICIGLYDAVVILLWIRRLNKRNVLEQAREKQREYHRQYVRPVEIEIQTELDQQYKGGAGVENPVQLGSLEDD